MSITATGGAEGAPPHDHAHGHAQGPLYKLAIGAIGIVFGDIGTSPIYAFRETFAGHHTLIPDRLHIYGVLSLIFWSMMIIVTLKYVSIIMRADNKGEGGSLALLALINRTLGGKKRWTSGIIMMGVFATALFYGDSMITPAISVLSAVEGLTTVNAGLAPFVIPIAVAILISCVRSSLSARWSWPSRVRRHCTRTWATSDASRSVSHGSISCCRRCF
jgi:KUP system potassium uptake protein